MNAKSPAIAPHSQFLNLVFQPIFQKQSYLNILYVLLAFPLGTIYFMVLIVGLTLTIGLLISVPALLVTFAAIRVFAKFEQLSTVWLLNVNIPSGSPQIATNQNFGARVGAYLFSINTWKSLGYLLAKFPIGVLSFSIAISLIALVVGLLISPFVYAGQVRLVYFGWKIDTLPEALLASLLSLGFGVISLHVINGLAFLQGRFAKFMLGSFSQQH